MNPFVLFDVGANRGQDSLDKTKNDININTWAFEPIPEFYDHIDLARKNGLSWKHLWQEEISGASYEDRYHVYPIALSNYDGESSFYIADADINGDWGVSSLYTFVDNVNNSWPGRNDLKTTRTINVKVSRFDTWYQTNGIVLDKIDFFHCDAQGSDLKVLQGMGDLINLIQQGVVECARDEQAKLYKENHTIHEMQDFLNSQGFEIIRTEANDIWSNESNIYFRKK
jgi:FkbM family methyltransferase